MVCLTAFSCLGAASLEGILRDATGRALSGAHVVLGDAQHERTAVTSADGKFAFSGLPPGSYPVSVRDASHLAAAQKHLEIQMGDRLEILLELTAGGQLQWRAAAETVDVSSTGGERLTSRRVSGLPLNKRDFSQLLLLAAGTQTDTNGAANFTQQFAVNGQRGTTAVFAMDGIETTDPEMGGATFSNFNVDAIEEIQSNSGVMPADIGHGAASFTNVVTKSGSDVVHGAIFEFVRNAALDARNFFDRRSIVNPGRLPPFERNEFGFTNGGPVIIPHVYNGRGKTFYFGQYQGFRQLLGTTQVLPVPTQEERRGLDTTAFAGDTLFVPVDPRIAAVLARYPMPNDPQGPYGARTYATSSKVTTDTDQFSVRIDHHLSDKDRLFFRFNFNNVNGPLTNPSQTAIDRTFAIEFLDRQRNAGITYTRTFSPNFVMESSLGYERSQPLFLPVNHQQPALKFADGLYEAFNAPGGTISGVWGNLYQGKLILTYATQKHTYKGGAEIRANRDTSVFGISTNGEYTFGGGTAYSPLFIPSRTGRHDIYPGDPLPDSLTGFLTATPFSYTISAAPPMFPQGDHIGWTAIRREAYNIFFEDTWRVRSRLIIGYGLRYEVNTPIREPTGRTSGPEFFLSPGGPAAPAAVREALLVNLHPTYKPDWNGWGPRLSIEWRPTDKTIWRAAGSLTTILPNLFQNNFITGGAPFVITPYVSATPGSPVPFDNAISQFQIPEFYTTGGSLLFATGRSTDVKPNTEWDVQRFQNDLAALTPGHQVRPLTVFGNALNFRNGYIASYTAGFDRDFSDIKLSASYVATIGVGLGALYYPNSYGGADPAFAPFTKFDDTGRVLGGYGPEFYLTNRGHSTFHSLQTSVQKTSPRLGLGFQANYTFSKSIDDVSSVLGGFFGSFSGTLQQSAPQNPWDTRAEKGPSTFDVTHVVALSLVEDLPFERWFAAGRFSRVLTSGWQSFGMITLTSGSPFTIYSGIQQTGAGSNQADRPDQTGNPDLSTSRGVREDYFGRGSENSAFFSIPSDVPGGTGPNHGRFGTLGRNTFRGPALHNFDMSLIKETPIGKEQLKLQFRAEFFNVFNLVNFGLPANIVLGPGFGLINRTAAPSRQIQFSLKLLY